jgi:hypothetical protein
MPGPEPPIIQPVAQRYAAELLQLHVKLFRQYRIVAIFVTIALQRMSHTEFQAYTHTSIYN